MAAQKIIYTLHYYDPSFGLEGREWEDPRCFESKEVAEFMRDGILMFQEAESELQVVVRAKALVTEMTVNEWLAARGPGKAKGDTEMPTQTREERLNNRTAQSGCDRCECGCKYWENDRCIDCGTKHDPEKFKEAV